MSNLEHMMMSYLLGELSEAEQAALEEKYFADPQVFDQVVKVENELVDSYVRGRLPPQAVKKFERHYLAHDKRRERVQFAQALLSKFDHIEMEKAVAQPLVEAAVSWRQRWLPSLLYGQRPALRVSIILASLLIVIGGLWSFIAITRQRQQQAETQIARASRAREAEEHARALEEPVANEQPRAESSATVAPPSRTQTQNLRSIPTHTARPAPAFVSLLLTGGGVRGGEMMSPATLFIPRGTQRVRLQLNLADDDYPRYQLILQAIGGAEIFSRQGLKPKTTASGARFVIDVAARKFVTGDYLLTLRGINHDGEVDVLSKSIFRAEKK